MSKKIYNKLYYIRTEIFQIDNLSRFADMLEVDRTLYYKWEKQQGSPSLYNALNISEILKIPVEEIWYIKEYD
ncbi:MAG: hypothetical protein JM58_09395 [Peptococcaceae bacterium BICA1-8]|nr:MAG: hypothetical protein JM58_09395 [Peptococcaceae bacterium BICA1-8]